MESGQPSAAYLSMGGKEMLNIVPFCSPPPHAQETFERLMAEIMLNIMKDPDRRQLMQALLGQKQAE